MLSLPILYNNNLETVERVDLHRFIGKWFTIASYPQRIGPIVHNTAVEYRLTQKGNLKISKIYKSRGRMKKDLILSGTGFVEKDTNNAKFREQFLWPFGDASCVIDLADDYSFAVISKPDKSSLTILSRNIKMDPSTYSAIIDRIKNKGFNTDRLKLTPEF